jgi:hypothetical protein
MERRDDVADCPGTRLEDMPQERALLRDLRLEQRGGNAAIVHLKAHRAVAPDASVTEDRRIFSTRERTRARRWPASSER